MTESSSPSIQTTSPKKQVPLELLFFCFYCVLFIVVTCFHEPWYDEAQAWMIARNASFKDILFQIPHYEGHPPLWHLILFPFARLGLPFEPCLKGISFVISAAAVWLLLYRSPFPKGIRLALPFTYFLFYQYGVISRPYCLLMLAFFLAAWAYPSRNEKPFSFVLSLMLLCAASSYGILFGGGIALAWLLELLFPRDPDMPLSGRTGKFLKSRQFFALLVLLAAALALIFLIFPAKDANGINLEDPANNLLFRIAYMFFVAPLDALFFQSIGYGALLWQKIPALTFAGGLLLGAILFAMLFLIGKRRGKALLFVIPYTLYAVFCANIYFWTHHTGIILLFFLFYLWCCMDGQKDPAVLLPEGKRPRFAYYMLTLFSLAMSLMWSATASYTDITRNYGHGRSLAAFIRENGLDQYRIMIAWDHGEDEKTGKITSLDVTNCTLGISALPYFSHNLFYNFREGLDEHLYSYNMLPSDARSEEVIRQCRSEGIPDIIVGYCWLEDIFPSDMTANVSYLPVTCIEDNYIWKNGLYETYYYVYVRTDLLNEIGLPVIPYRQ